MSIKDIWDRLDDILKLLDAIYHALERAMEGKNDGV